MSFSLIYFTINNLDLAKNISKNLLERQLIKCVNILPKMIAMYYWQTNLVEENEVVVLAKTSTAKVTEAMLTIKTLHPYECPAIFNISITQADADFLLWLNNSD